MNKKEIFRTLKPFNWMAASILTLFGILNTRMEIGMGRVSINIYIGVPTYFLLAISGMLLALWLQSMDEETTNELKNPLLILIFCGIFYSSAFVLALLHSIIYDIGVFNIISMILIGIIWNLSIFFGKKMENRSTLVIIISSFSFSFGFFYGATLNGWNIPFYIILFFIAGFSLQFSKEVIRSFKVRKNEKADQINPLIKIYGPIKTQRNAFYAQIVTIICITLPIFLNIYNSTLYLIPMLIVIFCDGIAAFLTFSLKLDEKYNPAIMILLRISVFIAFLMFLLGSV
ncbi:hypothetical protein DSAG12_03325 [Promethearchaeum syntrophicum]|uniref:Prenyltransferase n=1 Tax=Promethearchaeum syntrophicum TaxID=2594042 RepID=A0A5B9DE14_9ARCH|nr:hypothetical protein [Candidatus Prometheoarchaeum syntrophicum]